MKANQLCVRPASSLKNDFSIYWIYEINHAKELYSATKEECYVQKTKMINLLETIRTSVTKNFTKEVFDNLNTNEDTLFQLNLGALCFEFTVRDFFDNEGLEVNCECYILGKEGYGITGEYNDTILKGFPYDDEWCLNYYCKENMPFENRKEYIIDTISEFILEDSDYIEFALEQNLTWDSIKKKGVE